MRPWAAVIGSPIGHSLSPVLHEAAYAELGLDWTFTKYDVNPDDLPRFMADIQPGCVGLAVTAPDKQAIIPLLDTVDGLAKAVGAVNTCSFSAGLVAGFNTDVHGIVEAVRDCVPGRPLLAGAGKAAVILGTRATASSALAAVKTLGFEKITVVGRSFGGQGNVLLAAGRLGVEFEPLLWKHSGAVQEVCQNADLLISTVPPEATGALAAALRPGRDQTLLDVTYANDAAPLNVAYTAAGAEVISPLSMLVHQGLAQIKLWSGLEASFDTVYAKVVAAAQNRHLEG